MDGELRNRKQRIKSKSIEKTEKNVSESAVKQTSNKVDAQDTCEQVGAQQNEQDGSSVKGVLDHRSTNGNAVTEATESIEESIADSERTEVDGWKINFELDLVTIGLFLVAFVTRFYKLHHPNNVV